jgi:hypothetical protein
VTKKKKKKEKKSKIKNQCKGGNEQNKILTLSQSSFLGFQVSRHPM